MPRKTTATKADGGGLRFNGGKDRWDLLPMDATEQVVKVLTRGAEKYAERNWERGMRRSICFGSLMRHLARRVLGERHDAESGLPHLAHVACNALFLLAYDLRGFEALDDLEPFARAASSQKRGHSVIEIFRDGVLVARKFFKKPKQPRSRKAKRRAGR